MFLQHLFFSTVLLNYWTYWTLNLAHFSCFWSWNLFIYFFLQIIIFLNLFLLQRSVWGLWSLRDIACYICGGLIFNLLSWIIVGSQSAWVSGLLLLIGLVENQFLIFIFVNLRYFTSFLQVIIDFICFEKLIQLLLTWFSFLNNIWRNIVAWMV